MINFVLKWICVATCTFKVIKLTWFFTKIYCQKKTQNLLQKKIFEKFSILTTGLRLSVFSFTGKKIHILHAMFDGGKMQNSQRYTSTILTTNLWVYSTFSSRSIFFSPFHHIYKMQKETKNRMNANNLTILLFITVCQGRERTILV